MPGAGPGWSHGSMTHNSRDTKPGDRTFDMISMLGVVCVVLCVIAGLVAVGWFILLGLAMSRYGSNK
ncbi:hypothetical protein ActroDRAFT_0055 [Actinospica robiniae DSM 44927]|uniref:Uncharacterized protein n=2 Tax=Actinospica robiniae TaxID=304901 RepID=W9DZL8_9ACTN|nr:hypothetical protein ActroDRAFT_0055 [Actinospica robiniae DSM 44927]